jgi:hypothetical protein
MGKAVSGAIGLVNKAQNFQFDGIKSATGTGKRSMGNVQLDKSAFQNDLRLFGTQNNEKQRQERQLQRLEQISQGKTPSLAEMQLKQAQDRNLKQQLASAASGRGGNQAALQRALLRSQAEQGQATAQQAAQTRLQEQNQAEGMLADATLQKRQQDINLDQADKNARMQAAQIQSNLDLGVGTANLGAAQAADAGRAKLMGSFIGAGGDVAAASAKAAGPAAAASDKNEKKDIKDANKDVNSFLDAISAKSYEYKDTSMPGTAEGKRFGVMAQDLERSPMGKALVEEVNGTKMVNTSQGFGSVLAAQSQMHNRIKELEAQLNKKNKK